MPEPYALPELGTRPNFHYENRYITHVAKVLVREHYLNAIGITVTGQENLFNYLINCVILAIRKHNGLDPEEWFLASATRNIQIPTLDELLEYLPDYLLLEPGEDKIPVEEVNEISSFKVPSGFYNQFNGEAMSQFWAIGEEGDSIQNVTTKCNLFLPYLLGKLGEKIRNDIFPSKTIPRAKELYAYFLTNENLQEIGKDGSNKERAEMAQQLANDDYLIVTALDSETEGHVSVVGPQSLTYGSYPQKPWKNQTEAKQDGNGYGQVLRDYPVFIQAGSYTGVVNPGNAQGRTNLDNNLIHYFLYKPKP
jgi:hypothetical protein